MGYIIYDNKKIQPAPLMSVQKTYNRADDNTITGSSYNITLNGWILPNKGSPNSSGAFWDQTGYPPDEMSLLPDSFLAVLTRKQEAIRTLFDKNSQGKLFEVQSDNGVFALRCIVTVLDIDFQENVWDRYCKYTINLSTNELLPLFGNPIETFDELIESVSESWSIENNETPIDLDNLYGINVTHSLSAKGKVRYDGNGTKLYDAWEEARVWCKKRAGYNSGVVLDPSGLLYVPSSYNAYNHVRSENIDKFGGSYNLTESWSLSPSGAVEDFNISIQKSYDNSISTVSIEGSVQGMELRNSNMSIAKNKYDSAKDYYNSIKGLIHQRAQTFSSITLNPISKNSTESRNPLTGLINYNIEYDSRPTNLIDGAIYENITININDKSDRFASIPVLGRPDGPVLQPLNTSDEKRKSISIEAVFSGLYNPSDLAGSFQFPESKFQTLKDLVDPINNGARKSFLNQPQKVWEPITQRASVTYEWTYE